MRERAAGALLLCRALVGVAMALPRHRARPRTCHTNASTLATRIHTHTALSPPGSEHSPESGLEGGRSLGGRLLGRRGNTAARETRGSNSEADDGEEGRRRLRGTKLASGAQRAHSATHHPQHPATHTTTKRTRTPSLPRAAHGPRPQQPPTDGSLLIAERLPVPGTATYARTPEVSCTAAAPLPCLLSPAHAAMPSSPCQHTTHGATAAATVPTTTPSAPLKQTVHAGCPRHVASLSLAHSASVQSCRGPKPRRGSRKALAQGAGARGTAWSKRPTQMGRRGSEAPKLERRRQRRVHPSSPSDRRHNAPALRPPTSQRTSRHPGGKGGGGRGQRRHCPGSAAAGQRAGKPDRRGRRAGQTNAPQSTTRHHAAAEADDPPGAALRRLGRNCGLCPRLGKEAPCSARTPPALAIATTGGGRTRPHRRWSHQSRTSSSQALHLKMRAGQAGRRAHALPVHPQRTQAASRRNSAATHLDLGAPRSREVPMRWK